MANTNWIDRIERWARMTELRQLEEAQQRITDSIAQEISFGLSREIASEVNKVLKENGDQVRDIARDVALRFLEDETTGDRLADLARDALMQGMKERIAYALGEGIKEAL